MNMNVFANTTTTPEFWNVINGYNFERVTAEEIVKQGFVGNELVYSCVSTLARACSTFPTVLMDGERPVTDINDPVYKLYFGNWNHKHGKNESLYQVFINLILHGKSHTLKESEGIGLQTTELWPLPTQAVTPAQERVGYFQSVPFYTFNDGVRQYKYFPEELITVEYYDPSRIEEHQTGLSPIQPVWNTVKASNNRATAEGALLDNRGIAGFISPKAATGDAGMIGFSKGVIKQVRAAFADLIGGAKKFGRVEILEGAAEFTQLGLNATDLELVKLQLPQLRSVCRVLSLPSQKFGDFESSQYANFVEADRVFYTDAVIPNVELFNNQFQKDCLDGINARTQRNYHLVLDKDRVEALNTVTETQAPATTTEEDDN